MALGAVLIVIISSGSVYVTQTIMTIQTDILNIKSDRFTSSDGLEVWKEIGAIKEYWFVKEIGK